MGQANLTPWVARGTGGTQSLLPALPEFSRVESVRPLGLLPWSPHCVSGARALGRVQGPRQVPFP